MKGKNMEIEKENKIDEDYTLGDKVKKDKIKRRTMEWIYITIGAILVALGSSLFYSQFDLVTGGVIGIGIILKKLFNIPLWLTNMSLNIPLFVIAIMIKGKKIGIRSLYGTVVLTIALYISEGHFMKIDDIFLGMIYGAVISGAGIGFVFSGLGTTGGTDLIAIIIKHFFSYISIGNSLRIIETIIIICGAFIFGFEKALLAIIAIYLSTKVADTIIDGTKFGKTVFIISDRYEEIVKEIMKEMDRGVTALSAKGMYSGKDRKVIFCVITAKEVPLLKKIVSRVDDKAFIAVNDAKEVFGIGFSRNEIN